MPENCCTDMHAMILAAGLGERLRPHTLLRPKPLFPVCNRPLLDIILDHLTQAGFEDIVVNAHHLVDRLEAHLKSRAVSFPRITLQKEETILGTGGGIKKARRHFGHSPVMIWNGDIYSNLDPAMVMAEHRRSGAAATLVVHDLPRFNKVAVSAEGRILGFGDDRANIQAPCRLLAFTGIHVLDPDILHHLPAESFSSIIDCYRAVIREGGLIKALLAQDLFWSDIGTPADYLALHQTLLATPLGRQPSSPPDSPFLISKDARVAHDVRFSDWAVIGANAVIGAGTTLSRVVVWDGVQVPAGSNLTDAIISL